MYWNWKKGAMALGACFLLTVAFVKPIGVSTQFVVLDGIVADLLDSQLVTEDSASKSGYASTNAYLNKSGGKYAKSVAKPINYSFVFVVSMLAGGVLSGIIFRRLGGVMRQIPQVHTDRFGSSLSMRYGIAFLSGILVLFGARLAGGCTSGHMMSGMMQTSVSGYLFALAAFAGAIPTALWVYTSDRRNDRS